MTDAAPIPPEFAQARERFLAMVSEVRPELHRYCARIAGSVVDGEDIVQEALAKAFYGLTLATEVPPLRPWLFRVAHNTAIDFLRRYERKHVEPKESFDDMAPADEEMDPEVIRVSLASFLHLPVAQRSAVILKDVLGHSLEECADTMGATVPAVKAALVRGRGALRAQRSLQASDTPTEIAPPERQRLQRYVSLFNAKNWDGLRELMGEECKLDLVARASRRGKEVSQYFTQYAKAPDIRLEIGVVEGRPALLALQGPSDEPSYFIFLDWQGEKVSLIRDFRYVPYVTREAAITRASAGERPPPSPTG